MSAYNSEKYIGKAIQSCIDQTYKDLEIIIVEDCSTDNTLDIIKSYMEKDDRITLLRHERNMGAGQARRTGIDSANGEYFITIDSDDWIDNDFIEALVDRAIETESDIVSGGITVDRENGRWEKTCYGECILTEPEDKVLKFWGNDIVYMNNKIIRTKLREIIPYCTRRFIEDTPSIIPMLWSAESVAYTENTGYHYRMQVNSLTHKATPFKLALYRALCCMDILEFFEKHDPEILEKIPIRSSLRDQMEIIKRECPSNEKLLEDFDAWCELSKRMLL